MRKAFCAGIGTLAAVALGVGILNTVVSGAGSKPAPDIPIQVTFRNASSPVDRLMSDGISPSYTSGYNGIVSAVLLNSTGGVMLATCSSAKGYKTCNSQGRYQFFDFTDPYALLKAPPVSTLLQGAQMQVWAFAPDGVTHIGLTSAMGSVGAQYKGGSKINFDINGTMHTVRFTPNMYGTADYLLVTYLGGSLTCSTADPSKCATWTVEASSVAPGFGDIAELVTGDNAVDYGQFHMPFKITVSVLPK